MELQDRRSATWTDETALRRSATPRTSTTTSRRPSGVPGRAVPTAAAAFAPPFATKRDVGFVEPFPAPPTAWTQRRPSAVRTRAASPGRGGRTTRKGASPSRAPPRPSWRSPAAQLDSPNAKAVVARRSAATRGLSPPLSASTARRIASRGRPTSASRGYGGAVTSAYERQLGTGVGAGVGGGSGGDPVVGVRLLLPMTFHDGPNPYAFSPRGSPTEPTVMHHARAAAAAAAALKRYHESDRPWAAALDHSAYQSGSGTTPGSGTRTSGLGLAQSGLQTIDGHSQQHLSSQPQTQPQMQTQVSGSQPMAKPASWFLYGKDRVQEWCRALPDPAVLATESALAGSQPSREGRWGFAVGDPTAYC